MNKKPLYLLWIPALLLLALVLVIVNFPEKQPERKIRDGERLPDFTIDCIGGGSFHLEEHRGKVVVINLWATWCTPCVKELPHFDELQRNHRDDVAVIALHSLPVTSDVEKYLADYSYEIAFAIDEDGSISASVGASTVLPQTVVIDPDGVITYNSVGALTHEKLESLVREAQSPAE